MGSNHPSQAVLQAFGATEPPEPIGGGQGQNFEAGNLIFKPAVDDAETNWLGQFYETVQSDKFRLPQPIRTGQKALVFDGWQAWKKLDAQHEPGRWLEIIDVCIDFHAAITDQPIPGYFANRDQNPWVIADKITWGELDHLEYDPRIAPAVGQLRSCLEPIDYQDQLIHGDFSGNVMFSVSHPPAVIDFSPYWRPVEFAVGVIVADAIVWGGADESLIDAGYRFDNFDQHLARAELRRIIELETIHRQAGTDVIPQIKAHWPLIEMIANRCR